MPTLAADIKETTRLRDETQWSQQSSDATALQASIARVGFAERRRAAVDFAIRATPEELFWLDLWVVTAAAAQQMEAQPRQ